MSQPTSDQHFPFCDDGSNMPLETSSFPSLALPCAACESVFKCSSYSTPAISPASVSQPDPLLPLSVPSPVVPSVRATNDGRQDGRPVEFRYFSSYITMASKTTRTQLVKNVRPKLEDSYSMAVCDKILGHKGMLEEECKRERNRWDQAKRSLSKKLDKSKISVAEFAERVSKLKRDREGLTTAVITSRVEQEFWRDVMRCAEFLKLREPSVQSGPVSAFLLTPPGPEATFARTDSPALSLDESVDFNVDISVADLDSSLDGVLDFDTAFEVEGGLDFFGTLELAEPSSESDAALSSMEYSTSSV
eukprot:m.28565 g.28565  ORF g.28565 m.28565 type:complete len:305 (+) comp11856_c0_seq4:369-1283(+)